MGEHKDDEAELDSDAPIASISLGDQRDFVFRHETSRGKDSLGPSPVRMALPHGSLLVMWAPTNRYWYHSLPKRARSEKLRLNFTFRKMKV